MHFCLHTGHMPLEDGIENHCVIAAVVNTWPQGVTVAFVSVISSLVIGQTSFFLIASARTIFVIWGGREGREGREGSVDCFTDAYITGAAGGAVGAIGIKGAIAAGGAVGAIGIKGAIAAGGAVGLIRILS